MYISLYGACEELNVHLESDSVLLKKTYISLVNVRTVSLTNRSDIPLQYCWTTWPSLQEEALSLLRYVCMHTNDLTRTMQECGFDKIFCGLYKLPLSLLLCIRVESKITCCVLFFFTAGCVAKNSSGVYHFLSVCNSLFFTLPLFLSDPPHFSLCFFAFHLPSLPPFL